MRDDNMRTNGSTSEDRSSQQLGGYRPEELSVLDFANVLLRQRRLIAAVVGIITVVAVALLLRMPATYTSTAMFMPQSRTQLQGLSSIAAQFGFRLPTQEPGLSPAFYVELLRSRPILGAAVDTEYQTPAGPSTLPAHFRIEESDPQLRRAAAIERLNDALTVFEHRQTGVVNVSVRLRDAELGRLVNERLLELLHGFNLNTRQSQAASEARFTAERLEEAGRELRAREERLAAFLRSNREYRNSPALLFEHDRLARQVSIQQEVHSALAQAYEQARIEEVRNTPVITVVARPEAAVKPDARGRAGRLLLTLVSALMIGVVLAFWRDRTAPEREAGSTALQEFRRLQQEAWQDLRRPWRIRRGQAR